MNKKFVASILAVLLALPATAVCGAAARGYRPCNL